MEPGEGAGDLEGIDGKGRGHDLGQAETHAPSHAHAVEQQDGDGGLRDVARQCHAAGEGEGHPQPAAVEGGAQGQVP